VTFKSGEERPGLFASLSTKIRGAFAALRGFGRALLNRLPKTQMPPLSRKERIEEAKYHPAVPSSATDGEELPGSYGHPKVTLMVVDPYLVYAYWDVDLSKLPPAPKSAMLRFYDASEPGLTPSFDVDVDLRAPNWYVHLWSPGRSYYAHLGVKTAQGEFITLAKSNRVQTPRAWPVAETRGSEPPSATSLPTAGVPPPPTTREERRTEMLVPQRAPDKAADQLKDFPTERPAAHVSQTTNTLQFYPPKPVKAAEVLQQKLREIYALRSWCFRSAAMTEAPLDVPFGGGFGTSLGPVSFESLNRSQALPLAQAPIRFDLTALSEHRFSPGLPSSHVPAAPQNRRSS
jgi:hypothetical protein